MKRKWVSVGIFGLVCILALNIVHKPDLSKRQGSALPPCGQHIATYSTDLNISTEEKDWDSLKYLYRPLQNGGRYKPSTCTRNERVAIIVPYRDRERNLKIFLAHIHPFLQRQQRDYGIFLVEMQGGAAFNRGSSMNVGYVEAIKQGDYTCFIFQDVDLLPLRDEQQYTCSHQPIHLSSAIDQYNYSLPYPSFFGGVVAYTKQQYHQINGFANVYKGWGREDDDGELRTRKAGFIVMRPSQTVGRYLSLSHRKAKIRKQK